MKYPEIAKRFNYILTLRQLKARELADKVGMTEAAISHYVNGNRCPTNKTAVRLANVLRCNPLWLMDLDSEMIKGKEEPKEPLSPSNQKLFDALKNLPEELIDDALDYIGYKLTQYNREHPEQAPPE